LDYTWENFKRAINGTLGVVESSLEWTDELLDWEGKKDLERPRKLKKNNGYRWINNGKASGKIIGGCLSSLFQLSDTPFDLDYNEKILFFEIPEGQNIAEGEPLSIVRKQLFDLKNKGVLNKIKGVIIGRSFRYSEKDSTKLMDLLKEVFEVYNYPVLANTDIGHSDPVITIPLNIDVELDSKKNLFRFIEQGVD